MPADSTDALPSADRATCTNYSRTLCEWGEIVSWRATAWAKKLRLGSPAAKSILLCLADYAESRGGRCWPSQASLASDAEVSERTVRIWLKRFEELGFIRRERRNSRNGARNTDVIILCFTAEVREGDEKCQEDRESEDEDHQSAAIAGGVLPAERGSATGILCKPTGNGRRSSIEEPSNVTLQRTSHRRAWENGGNGLLEDERKTHTDFWQFVKGWPGHAGMSKKAALRVWTSLSPQDRSDAKSGYPAWLALLKAQKKSFHPSPYTYLSQALWSDVPGAECPHLLTVIEAKPFGPLWSLKRFRILFSPSAASMPPPGDVLKRLSASTDGVDEAERMRRQAIYGWPPVNRMHEDAQSRRGATVDVHLQQLEKLMEPVLVGSPLWIAWEHEHRRRGWPWFSGLDKKQEVFFPKGGPATLKTFKTALIAHAELRQTR
jgi:hypothetical protein